MTEKCKNQARQSKQVFTCPTNTKKEHYSQVKIEHLFISTVLPNFSDALSLYSATESDLTVIQNF